EIAPIAWSFLGQSHLTPYLSRFQHAVRLYSNGSSSGLATEASQSFIHIVTKNVGMTVLMLFATPSITARLRAVATAGVGTGVWEMGNKGAVGVRLGLADHALTPQEDFSASLLGESGSLLELTFVAAHLAAMETAVERRNEDWANIVRKLVFVDSATSTSSSSSSSSSSDSDSDTAPLLANSPPTNTNTTNGTTAGAAAAVSSSSKTPLHESGIYRKTSHLVVAGDLNYRSRSTPPSATDARTAFPSPDLDANTNADDFLILAPLLATDQLTQERTAHRTLHNLSEAAIRFAPTYKLSISSRRGPGQENDDDNTGDSSDYTSVPRYADHRWPSWCDRILYAAREGVKVSGYTSLSLLPTTDHRAVALTVEIPATPLLLEDDGDDGDVEGDPDVNIDEEWKAPFELDPQWRAKRAKALRYELIVGVLAYLTWTREGEALLLGMAVGCAGGWWVMSALLYG
ncbi:MAG: hypothetical protein M1825_006250, partial [Sarcosagium campestre]